MNKLASKLGRNSLPTPPHKTSNSIPQTDKSQPISNPTAQGVSKFAKPSSLHKHWQVILNPAIKFFSDIRQRFREKVINYIVAALMTGFLALIGWISYSVLDIFENKSQPEIKENIDKPEPPSWSPTIKLNTK